VKLESQKAQHPQLLYESKLYKILQGGAGIPHIRLGLTCFVQEQVILGFHLCSQKLFVQIINQSNLTLRQYK
jgi:hypothetical protein